MRALLIGLVLLPCGCGARRAEWHALENPNDADAWEKLGNARRRSLHPRLAVEAYVQAYTLDPSRDYLRKRMSRAHSREVERLRRAALTMPDDDELWGDLGDALRLEGDLDGATGAYLRAFQIDPYDGEWQEALGTLGATEDLAQAMEATLDSSNDESLGDWGDMLASQGRHDEACDAYRQAAELDPWDEEWIRHALECGYEIPEGYTAMGDTGLYGGAMFGGLYGHEPAPAMGLPDASDLAGLQAQVESDVGLLVRLGQAYLQAGDADRAEETLWGALLVAPTETEALETYMIATRRSALDVLEALYATFPDDDEVVGALADHHLALGHRDKARLLYIEAHDLDPEDPEWTAKRTLLDGTR